MFFKFHVTLSQLQLQHQAMCGYQHAAQIGLSKRRCVYSGPWWPMPKSVILGILWPHTIDTIRYIYNYITWNMWNVFDVEWCGMMCMNLSIALRILDSIEQLSLRAEGRNSMELNWGGVVRTAMPSGQARDGLSRFGECRTWRILAHMNGWVMSSHVS